MDFRIFYLMSNTEKNAAAAAPSTREAADASPVCFHFDADDSQVNVTLQMETSIPFNFIDTVCVAISFCSGGELM